MKQNTIVKDAIILFCITLISGLGLGLVYNITKEPIAIQKEASNQAAYKLVYPEAASFEETEELVKLAEESEQAFAEADVELGNIYVDKALEAKDESGNVLGHVVSVTTKDGYGGNISLSVGIMADGTVTGVEILEISETAGLGMRATEEEFRNQYKNKHVQQFTLTKTGKKVDYEIDALSGATITSSAVTNAVNGALYFVNNMGGSNE